MIIIAISLREDSRLNVLGNYTCTTIIKLWIVQRVFRAHVMVELPLSLARAHVIVETDIS